MYLKVEYKKKATEVFLIEKKEFIVGNSEICDVKIDHPSISRRHLKFIEKNNLWYASDQGSTNGTYLQGEQLIPGEKIQLQPGLKLRLSQFAFVSLREEADDYLKMREIDEETKIELENSKNDKVQTQIIKMPQFQEQKAHALRKRKQEKLLKEKELQKEISQTRKTRLKFLLMLSVIIYVSHFINELFNEETKVMREQNVVDTVKETYDNSLTEKEASPFKISALLNPDQLSEKLMETSCVDEAYKNFCLEDGFFSNVYEFDLLKVVFLVDFNQWLARAKQQSPAIEILMNQLKEREVNKILFLELLKSQNNTSSFPAGKDIYIVFFNEDDQQNRKINFVTAFSQIYSDNILSKYYVASDASEMSKMIQSLDKYYSYY